MHPKIGQIKDPALNQSQKQIKWCNDKEAGFAISAEELKKAQVNEISDEELEARMVVVLMPVLILTLAVDTIYLLKVANFAMKGLAFPEAQKRTANYQGKTNGLRGDLLLIKIGRVKIVNEGRCIPPLL